jgi:hypothetical protein
MWSILKKLFNKTEEQPKGSSGQVECLVSGQNVLRLYLHQIISIKSEPQQITMGEHYFRKGYSIFYTPKYKILQEHNTGGTLVLSR